MPKVVKTVKSAASGKSAISYLLNVVEATAAALGSKYTMLESNKRYYIPMDSVGYPEFSVLYDLGGTGSNVIYSSIYLTNSVTNLNDKNSVSVASMPITSSILLNYNPATCVLFADSTNDAISFSVIPSAYDDGRDNSELNICSSTFKAFVAKDKNEDVLCGVGKSHIHYIRTRTKKLEFPFRDRGEKADYDSDTLPTVLHLTKMVNYLSPGYPEMKTAYISVARPNDGYINESYYSSNARWGFAGYYKPEPPSEVTSATVYKRHISPWVKY